MTICFRTPVFRAALVLSAFVAVPVSTASADPGSDVVMVEKFAVPKAKFNRPAAKKLCRTLKATPEFETLKAKSKAANGIANEICRFYAIPPAKKQKQWDRILAKLVKAKKLTRKDSRVLSKLLVEPEALATWKPQTAFGQSVLELVGGGDEDDVVTANSTAGDIGTIAGAILGGLGGSPASVALGAALGKLGGEAVDQLAQAAYDLAPDDGPTEGGGDDGGGDDSGDGGGEGGGEEGK